MYYRTTEGAKTVNFESKNLKFQHFELLGRYVYIVPKTFFQR